MNLNAATSLVPYQGIVMPLLAVQQRAVSPFPRRDPSGGGMRFLGYGMPKGGSVYGSSGRIINEPVESGNNVDIYV